MAKMTSGVLCRDRRLLHGRKQRIILFYPADDPEKPYFDEDIWKPWTQYQWHPGEWGKKYQLYDESGKKIPPPKPGESMKIEIEL